MRTLSEMEIVVVLIVWDNDAWSNEECRRMVEETLGFFNSLRLQGSKTAASAAEPALSATPVLPNQKNGCTSC
jgi:hypothetical protein